jgi:hypothetical protein
MFRCRVYTSDRTYDVGLRDEWRMTMVQSLFAVWPPSLLGLGRAAAFKATPFSVFPRRPCDRAGPAAGHAYGQATKLA